MESMLLEHPNTSDSFHLERPRLNNLLIEAMRYPLTVICAGAGYGKTRAVHDFVENHRIAATWIELSEQDNTRQHFWENFVHTMTEINLPLAKTMSNLGFPDDDEKINSYLTMLNELTDIKQRLLVFDNFHLLEDPSVFHLMEECGTRYLPAGCSLFLITRSIPRINIAGLVSRGRILNISESELRFTEDELAQYFQSQGISFKTENFREIMRDTEGWAFAVNLIARSYKKAPGYGGYLQSALKKNIFQLMESEIWKDISRLLRSFLVKLSLIDHLSVDLINLLASGDKDLIYELEKQSAFVRHDNYINAYLIHPLFLEFLNQKQELLTEAQKKETYTIAGDWCNSNGFKIDALTYYENTGDYSSIVSILYQLPSQMPYDIAKFAVDILDRAPQDEFDKIEFLAIIHLRSCICHGLWEKSIKLAEYYEAKFLKLPEDDPFRNRNLGRLYLYWSYMRTLMCASDDRYDFDVTFEKFCKCYPLPIDPGMFPYLSAGPFLNCAGSAKKGAPEECIETLIRISEYASRYLNFLPRGEVELARGELKFYQGETFAADALTAHALERNRLSDQYELMHKGLFYTLRIAVAQGNYALAEQTLKELKSQLDESEHTNRFINYDIAISWYYCTLGLPEKVPHWIKENFTPYGHAGFVENFGNQMKARFCYITRRYSPLLSYIAEMKMRESFLFGRVEMLAMEACIFYKMKRKNDAFVSLKDAYETASPNEIVMPFIELGKDMRTLSSVAMKDKAKGIPASWLKSINRKAASYAKRRAHIIAKYNQDNGITGSIVISPRETDILTDLSHGLSRAEIADSRNLSVNTVKMLINALYTKVGAENLADLIRIAVERRLI